jgi:type VI secretion system secreted protein Hcp
MGSRFPRPESRSLVVLVLVAMVGMLLGWLLMDRVDASTAPSDTKASAIESGTGEGDTWPGDLFPVESTMSYFAKYEAIDGEVDDDEHDKWIEILSYEWGVGHPSAGVSGETRRRGSAVVEDLVIALEYEKAAPKLLEKCLKGAVIPTLEIELTNVWGDNRQTYLRYEMKNVLITDYHVAGEADSGGPPVVVVGNNFEEIKVTYTEYDDEGNSKGNVETEWKVEKGE